VIVLTILSALELCTGTPCVINFHISRNLIVIAKRFI
jgi:hypothetical protein